MTTNKLMTGEQLDELMTVAVRMQRDAEIDSNRPSANFAYAVQVTVLELLGTREMAASLSAELKQSQIDAGCYKHGMEASNERLVQVVAENVALKQQAPDVGSAVIFEAIEKAEKFMEDGMPELAMVEAFEILKMKDTPATDAYLGEVRAQAHMEGAHFVANRMLAAWDAGFIEDTAKNAADIARMILTSTEFMPNAPEGDFDRSFADGVLEDIAAQLRQDANTAELVAAGIITKVGE